MNEIQLTDHLVAHIGAEGTCGRIAHPETPAPHKDDFTPEFIEPLI